MSQTHPATSWPCVLQIPAAAARVPTHRVQSYHPHPRRPCRPCRLPWHQHWHAQLQQRRHDGCIPQHDTMTQQSTGWQFVSVTCSFFAHAVLHICRLFSRMFSHWHWQFVRFGEGNHASARGQAATKAQICPCVYNLTSIVGVRCVARL